jgi:uncharacterized protein YeaO (DUF488 family)
MIHIKRAYEPPGAEDGSRYLVDRIWPRGVTKEQLRLKGWYKEVAPSNELRHWFGHEPSHWTEFKKRYYLELDNNQEAWNLLLEEARSGGITLVYGAKDKEHNNAIALKEYLEEKLKGKTRRG